MSVATFKIQRIAIVSDSIYPYNKGGKEIRIHELSIRLAAAGHDVHLYTMQWWDGPKDRTEDGVHMHAISRLYPLYAGERRSIKEGLLFGLACFKLLKASFDVVDVDQMPYFPLFSMRIVAWLKGRPMVATWHEVWGREYWREYLGQSGLIAYLIEKTSVFLPTTIIAVSEMTRARLTAELKTLHQPALIRNGLDLAVIDNVSTKRPASDIMFVGRLIEHKHADVLLDAVALLAKTRPDVRCLIIGDGPERAALEAQAAKLKLQANLKFLGFLPNHLDVYAYMKASKVFVLPSTREGFGISVIEANACGLPAVTIDHPANAARYLINDTTGRLAELNAGSLAAQISSLLDAAPARSAVRDAVAAYDWASAAHDLQEVYAS